MSFDRFVELLQQLITMTDPRDQEDVLNARNILKNLLELASRSEMADALTIRTMDRAYMTFTGLLHSKEDFAGKPGDVAGNKAKRNRLAMLIRPGC